MPLHQTIARIAGTTAMITACCFLGACEVEQTDEGRLPDIDVDAEPGRLPQFEQTQEGELPDVDVDVSGGDLPDFDVDAPDIDVGTREEQIDVPTGIDVETEERTITVPDVDVNTGDEDDTSR